MEETSTGEGIETVMDAIRWASAKAGINEVVLANISEAQKFIESFKANQYPINVIVPWTMNGTTDKNTGIRNAVIPFQGWVITRTKENQIDYRSVKVEELYIEPMRILAAKFIKNLLKTDVIDLQVLKVTDTIKPEYFFLNQQLMGVSYNLNLPVISNVC
jgi:hypothetical protein